VTYLTEILAEDRLTDWRLFKKLKPAEDTYFRAFAAVVQQTQVRRADGKFILLMGCYLYEVRSTDLSIAMAMVKNNEARRLHSSDDSMCGVPIILELFRVIH
jgi:hypothetical protein